MEFPVKSLQYTRKYKRYPTHREARYLPDNISGSAQLCTIVNVSRKGMGIIFHTDEEMRAGTVMHIEVPLTQCSEPIKVRGILRWVDRMEIDSIGGVELVNELSTVELSRLNTSSS